MKTLYAACISRLGLSLSEAAALHGVRLDTVKSWSSGRNRVPAGAWRELRAREDLIVERSEVMREIWAEQGVPLELAATWRDQPSLMALADFVLNNEVLP